MSAGLPDARIRDVSDTALWVATYRALESERPDAHFRDPFARRLAGERGAAIVAALPHGHSMAWTVIVRTVLFDELVQRAVQEHGVDTILDLAAGLDARPWRLELPAALRWVDVDLPGMVAYKREALAGEAPRCRYEARAMDLRDAATRQALLSELGRDSRRALVLTEGLLLYLDEPAVAELARDLAAVPAFREWVLDLASPALLAWVRKGWQGATGPAEFRFAPASGTRFFEPHGWREAEFRSTWEEARRLHREMRGAWLRRLRARLASREKRELWRRFSGVVLLERSA